MAFVATIGSDRFLTYVPYDLLVWAPISALIILGLRYSGIRRMIYAIGDNPVASRLAGVRVWQVQLVQARRSLPSTVPPTSRAPIPKRVCCSRPFQNLLPMH